MKTDALAMIASERERQQKVEGWTPEHDDEHCNGDLAAAAGCYAIHAGRDAGFRASMQRESLCQHEWPWGADSWKPSPGCAPPDRIRELVKAGALIVAEIERLQRLEGQMRNVTDE